MPADTSEKEIFKNAPPHNKKDKQKIGRQLLVFTVDTDAGRQNSTTANSGFKKWRVTSKFEHLCFLFTFVAGDSFEHLIRHFSNPQNVSSHFMTTVQTPTDKRKKPTSVWLIDDNEIDNFINRKVLESCGLTDILTFTDTTTALQHLTQTTDFPQLILLDLYLPIMDGFDFLDKFAKLEIARQPIDIFILTCSIYPPDKEKARQKNCPFIDKPLTEEKLFAQLDTLDKDGNSQRLTES